MPVFKEGESPNILLALIDYLSTHSLITSYGSVHVAPNLNGYTGTGRWVEVKAAPGRRNGRIDVRPFDLNCYGEDLNASLLLAEKALAAAMSMRGTYTTGDYSLVVTETEVGITPFDLTDQLDNRYRFVANVVIHFRPA